MLHCIIRSSCLFFTIRYYVTSGINCTTQYITDCTDCTTRYITDCTQYTTYCTTGCTYCTPQVASIGLTEAKAKEAGHKVKVGRFPFMGNGKAIALGEPEGLVKTVFDAKTGELIGAHMVGAEVTELIQGYGIAKTLETTEAELIETVFPHPTLSEMMHEAVLDAYGRVIHI